MGRLALLITMDLILKSVYNSVNAPTHRGFSYIEIWMIGVQIPILIGIFEHGFLLAMKKYYQSKPDMTTEVVEFLADDTKPRFPRFLGTQFL